MSEVTVQGGQEVVGVGRIEGPIMIVEGGTGVSYDEVVEIKDARGKLHLAAAFGNSELRFIARPPFCVFRGGGGGRRSWRAWAEVRRGRRLA